MRMAILNQPVFANGENKRLLELSVRELDHRSCRQAFLVMKS